MLGKTEGGRRRGWQRVRWLDGTTYSMEMSLSKLQEMKGGEPGVLQSMGSQRVRHDRATELKQTFGKLCLPIWRITFHVNPLKSFKEKYIEKEPVVLSRLSELACQRCSLSLHSNAYHILPWVTRVRCSCQEDAVLQSHLLKSASENGDGTGTSSFMSPSQSLEE